MMPRVPTPAAARYSAAGEPRPPAPSSSTLDVEQLLLAGLADLGEQEVALVAVALLGVERCAASIQGRPSFFQRLKPPAIDTTSV